MEVWKPKESIIKAIIAWAESNNFKYVNIHEDFANGCIETDDWHILAVNFIILKR